MRRRTTLARDIGSNNELTLDVWLLERVGDFGNDLPAPAIIVRYESDDLPFGQNQPNGESAR